MSIFFGIDHNYMLSVYKQINRIKYHHFSWTLEELYNIPTKMRDYIFEDVSKMLQEIDKKMKENSHS